MWLNKAQTWALADSYGHLETIRQQTLTCYNGIQGTVAASAQPAI